MKYLIWLILTIAAFGQVVNPPTGGGGGGTITGVTAGTGLSGGGTSGTVTLNMANTSTAVNGRPCTLGSTCTAPVNNENVATNASYFPLFTATQGGNYAANTLSTFTFNPSTLALRFGSGASIGSADTGAPAITFGTNSISLNQPLTSSSTIDATKLTGNLPAISGASLTSVNASTLGSATFAAPGTIGGTTPGIGDFSAHNCGVLNTTACVFTGFGSSSGTATLTWPAVAGTVANPITTSNAWEFPNGTATAPSIIIGQYSNFGLYLNQANLANFGYGIGLSESGSDVTGFFGNWGIVSVGNRGFCWTGSGNLEAGSISNCITRPTDGTFSFDTTALGNGFGKVNAAGYISVGTTFTSNGGLDEGTLLGGATAGKFTTSTLTTGSTVITMGNSATAPHGWRCSASDITHPLDIVIGTSLSVTQCTLTVAVAITLNDVIEFSAIGY
jgi:hypothetical protein